MALDLRCLGPCSASVGLGILALLLLAFLAWSRRRELNGPALSLFRVLLPSWRFFETVQPAPRLLCRMATRDAEFGPFEELLLAKPRTPLGLLLNAEGNLRLHCFSVIEQLLGELEQLETDGDATALVPYRLLERIVQRELCARWGTRQIQRYQFCLREDAPHGAGSSSLTLLTSPIYEHSP